MRKAWKAAVFGMMVGTACAGGLAFAGNPPNAKHIQYAFYQNTIYSISYKIAWDHLKPIYKGSQYEPMTGFSQANPMIAIGEFDLNGDKIPEIIAHPTEDEAEEGLYCRENSVCPHYLLEVRGKKVHELGKIFASSIDRGDKITNGYWDLKVYSGDWTEPKSTAYDLFVYDKGTDKYIKAKAQPAAPAPQNKR